MVAQYAQRKEFPVGDDQAGPGAVVLSFTKAGAWMLRPGRMIDEDYCLRAGCIHQDLPGPSSCQCCVNWWEEAR